MNCCKPIGHVQVQRPLAGNLLKKFEFGKLSPATLLLNYKERMSQEKIA